MEEPAGGVVAVTNGVARCRYREGWDHVVPLAPGREVDLLIRMNHVGSRVACLIGVEPAQHQLGGTLFIQAAHDGRTHLRLSTARLTKPAL